MAQVRVRPKKPPTTIDRFLGINEDSTGDTQLELGESPNMVNFRITEDFKLRKREGYVQLFDKMDTPIRGMWYGKLNGEFTMLFATDGNLHKHKDGVNISIGPLTNDKTHFFYFEGKVYVMNGHEYKSYDGTTFKDVEGYIPLIATATPPTGGGSPNEQINLLTGKKRQTFSANGTAKEYQLAEADLTSVDVVKVNGTVKNPTEYSSDLVTGKVTFVVEPTTGQDNVDIQWTKGEGQRAEVFKNTISMFYGGKNDTRVFIYGSGTNQYYFTGLADGKPSAEYFPANNYRRIGSDQFAVTDIVRQYDRQIIFTNGGDTWYSYYDPIIDVAGNVIADFPTFPLNDTVGNVAVGQVQIIKNNPVSLWRGVHEWVASDVRDERNEVYISKRIQQSLNSKDLSKAITFDWERRWEYWICFGSEVFVHNYRLDVWYKFSVSDTITSFLEIEGDLYFGTSEGQIMKFDRTLRDDNGRTIRSYWEMGFYDFGTEWLRKFLNRVWVSIQPGSKERVDLSWQTDNSSSNDPYVIEYNLLDYGNLDYGDWSYLTYYNPQPIRLKIKAKKFVYFKLILTNDSLTENVTILSINLLSRTGGESK